MTEIAIKTAHTPGPWTADGQVKSVGEDGLLLWCGHVEPDRIEVKRAWRGWICDVQSAEHIDGIDTAEAEANAKLIAAAPDLLAALQLAQSLTRSTCPTADFITRVNEAVNAAIAKATS